MSYKIGDQERNTSSENEYGAKQTTNMKRKINNYERALYLSNSQDKSQSNKKRRGMSQENSRDGSISLSTQKVVLNKERSISQSSSVENVHTFYLKQSMERPTRKNSMLSSGDGVIISNKRLDSVNSEGDLGSGSVYVEERVKLLKNSQYAHVYSSLKELGKQIKEFKAVYVLTRESQNNYLDHRSDVKKKLNISFNEDNEIASIIKDEQFKINTRSVLGVKNTNDWIYGLNIGNIMHLSPMEFDDLTKEFSEVDGNSKTIKELTSDSILEKIIYLASAYFCIATELRFLHKKVDSTKFTMKASEMWHAKAVHTAGGFLPKESPLAVHIHGSYIKHGMKPKIEQRELMKKEQEKRRKEQEFLLKKQIEEEKVRQAKLEKEAQEQVLKNLGMSNSRNNTKSNFSKV